MKAALCRSNATDKDYYLSQFVILTLLVEFFDGQGKECKSREYMRVGELQNCISKRLKEGQRAGEKRRKRSRELHFRICWRRMRRQRSEEKGSRARTTKEGFLYHLLTFAETGPD